MSKEKYALSAIVVSGLVVSLGVSMYVFSNPKETKRSSAAPLVPTSENSETLSNQLPKNIYRDESGFSFSYSSDMLVTDATPGVGPAYTILNITKGSDSMRVNVEDTDSDSIDSWLAKENVEWELVGAVSLDGIPAKQYRSATQFATVSLDQGVLYTIKSPLTDEWATAHDLLVSTFAFETTSSPQTVGSAKTTQAVSGGGIVYDPEVIVE